MDESQRNLAGTLGVALLTGASLAWQFAGPGTITSAERIAPAAVLFVCGGVLLWLAWRKPGKGEPDMSDRNQPQPGSVFHVTSHGQTGGVTAGQFINQAPQPSVDAQQISKDEPIDGRYVSRYRLSLSASYAINRLEVRARGNGVEEAVLKSGGPVDVFFNVLRGQLPDGSGAFMGVDRPPASLILEVTTDQPGRTVDLEAVIA